MEMKIINLQRAEFKDTLKIKVKKLCSRLVHFAEMSLQQLKMVHSSLYGPHMLVCMLLMRRWMVSWGISRFSQQNPPNCYSKLAQTCSLVKFAFQGINIKFFESLQPADIKTTVVTVLKLLNSMGKPQTWQHWIFLELGHHLGITELLDSLRCNLVALDGPKHNVPEVFYWI